MESEAQVEYRPRVPPNGMLIYGCGIAVIALVVFTAGMLALQ